MPITDHLSYLMKLISDRADTLFAQRYGTMDITAPQCRVLMYLQSRQGGEPVSQRELERYLGVSHTTVKGLLRRLEEKGLVRTAFDHPADARVKHAYLTERQIKLHRDMEGTIRSFEEELVAGISPEERRRTADVLRRIYNNILPSEHSDK